MKSKNLLVLLMALAMALTVVACGSDPGPEDTEKADEAKSGYQETMEEYEGEEQAEGTPDSLEAYFDANPSVQAMIESELESYEGITVDVKDNTMTYTMEIDLAAENIKFEDAKSALEGQKATLDAEFDGLVDDLESQTGVSGIQIKVIYTEKGTGNVIAEFAYPA